MHTIEILNKNAKIFLKLKSEERAKIVRNSEKLLQMLLIKSLSETINRS